MIELEKFNIKWNFRIIHKLHYLVTCYLIKLTRPKDATHLKRAHTTRVATKSVFEDRRSSFMKNFRISNTKQCICPQKNSECQRFYEYQILNSIHLWIPNSWITCCASCLSWIITEDFKIFPNFGCVAHNVKWRSINWMKVTLSKCQGILSSV